MIKTWLKHTVFDYALNIFFDNLGHNLFNKIVADRHTNLQYLEDKYFIILSKYLPDDFCPRAKRLLLTSLHNQSIFNYEHGADPEMQSYTHAIIIKLFQQYKSWNIGNYNPQYYTSIECAHILNDLNATSNNSYHEFINYILFNLNNELPYIKQVNGILLVFTGTTLKVFC
jgi:hypothetical protein